jgi:nucleolar protein 58
MAPVFVLSETSAGYVLLKAKDKKILKNGDIAERTKTATDTAELYVVSDYCP